MITSGEIIWKASSAIIQSPFAAEEAGEKTHKRAGRATISTPTALMAASLRIVPQIDREERAGGGNGEGSRPGR